jgi:hypothetical protein
MPILERGQTFINHTSTLGEITKAKYFIAMNNADNDNDPVVCFVFNTENYEQYYKHQCIKPLVKFNIEPNTFSFIKNYTSIMLKIPVDYKLHELFKSNIDFLDKADELLQRQIKNCIDFGYLLPKHAELIKSAFK